MHSSLFFKQIGCLTWRMTYWWVH